MSARTLKLKTQERSAEPKSPVAKSVIRTDATLFFFFMGTEVMLVENEAMERVS